MNSRIGNMYYLNKNIGRHGLELKGIKLTNFAIFPLDELVRVGSREYGIQESTFQR